ncbi:MAG: hypothetical protein CMJ62_12845 [Planctomycetaceae bacterium]|nr:hypothetical protein [Planctomycetaceae bacterium]
MLIASRTLPSSTRLSLAGPKGTVTMRAARLMATFALAYLPFGPWLNQEFPLQLLGFSFFATAFPTAIIVLALLVVAIGDDPKLVKVPSMMAAIGLTIAAFRILLGVNPEGGLAAQLNQLRFFVLAPIMLLLWRPVLADRSTRNVTSYILIGHGLFFGILSMGYVLGLHTIGVESVNATVTLSQGTRYVGFAAGANVHGGLMALLFAYYCLSPIREKRLFWVVLGPVTLTGVMSSGSRCAAAASCIQLCCAAILLGGKQRIAAGLGVVFLLGALSISDRGPNELSGLIASLQERIDRTAEGGETRWAKTQIGLAAISQSWQSLLAGTDANSLILGPEHIDQFSDNSYIQMATIVGVPATCLFLWLCIRTMRVEPGRRRLEKFGYWSLISVTMLLNNAILWDIWLYFASAIYWLVFLPENESMAARCTTRGTRLDTWAKRRTVP